MKKQLVDYRGFSLRRLNEPQFSHLKLLGGWIFYFAMYFITENLIPPEKCHPIHCALDDLIPFNEFFVIFYVGWYLLVVAALAYTLFFDVPRFRKVQIYIIVTQVLAMFCYVVFPSRQDLRPEMFPRESILTALIAFIYSFDTNTGVCPSLHVAYSMGILSVALKDDSLEKSLKTALAFIVLMICLAVCFVKQHSAADVFAAIPICLIAEWITFGKDYWKPRFQRKNEKLSNTGS